MCRLLKKTLDVLDDLPLCSDDNDAARATNKLYAFLKSCNCPTSDLC